MLDLDKLRKIWALTASPSRGEAAAARNRAKRMVEREGYTLDDIPELLERAAREQSNASAGGYSESRNRRDKSDREAAAKARAAAAAEEVDRRKAFFAYRESVIARYGSVDAGKRPNATERAVDEAVAAFERDDGSLDGWLGRNGEDPPVHVIDAMKRAIPLPATISAAKTEYDAWAERDRELRALGLYDGVESFLSNGCQLREHLVRELVRNGLRAQCVADVLARQRWLIDSEMVDQECDRAVLADLEHLAGLEASVQIGQTSAKSTPGPERPAQTTSQRRAEVIRLLSSMDTSGLSDREIARRVGVSPQTVGNIRRRRSDGAPMQRSMAA